MGTKLTNAPVFYTLTQVQFNTVMQLPNYIPEIQERLRQAGYPDFIPEQQSIFQLQPVSSDSQPNVISEFVPKWSFMNIHKTEGFVLLRDGLIYHTTEYKDSETFYQKVLMGLEIVHSVVSLALVRRIGLRFLDVINPEQGETLDQYVVNQVLGLRGIASEHSLHSMSESVFNNPNETVLVSRVMTGSVERSAPFMPNELLPLPLKLKERFESISGDMAVMDTDTFIIPSQSREFSLELIHNLLKDLKKNITFAFESIVTPYALKRWQ